MWCGRAGRSDASLFSHDDDERSEEMIEEESRGRMSEERSDERMCVCVRRRGFEERSDECCVLCVKSGAAKLRPIP